MKDNHPSKLKHWLGPIIMALCSVVCLLLFYHPSQPKKLTSMIGSYDSGKWLEHKDIFPASGLLTGMVYRRVGIFGFPTKFYIDFIIPEPDEKIRIWITPEDQDRILQEPDIEVRAYAVDIFNPNKKHWVRYVAKHPHGHGSLFLIGVVLAVFALVLVVKNVCFTDSFKQKVKSKN